MLTRQFQIKLDVGLHARPAALFVQTCNRFDSEIIICDEATSALDMSVQKTVIELLTRLQRERQVAYLFIF